LGSRDEEEVSIPRRPAW